MNLDKFQHIAGDICLTIKECEAFIEWEPPKNTARVDICRLKTMAYIDCAGAYYHLFKHLQKQGWAGSDCNEVLAKAKEYTAMFTELIKRLPAIEEAARQGSEERLKQEQAKEKAERRQKAEAECQKAEKIFKTESVSRSDRDKLKNILSNAIKHDGSYGKGHYLFGKLAYETYLDACDDPRKNPGAAADIVRQYLLSAMTLSDDFSEFGVIVDARLLLIRLEISVRNIVVAKEHYQALDGLKRSAEYTESQSDRLSKIEDALFPEMQQEKEDELIKQREEERAQKEADKFLKKQAQQNAAIEKEQKELARKVEQKAIELGISLAGAAKHYVAAKVYEQALNNLHVGNSDKQKLLINIVSEYTAAIELDSDYYAAYYDRGMFRQKNDPDHSEINSDFQRLLAVEGYKIKARFALGKRAQSNNNIAEAIKHYETNVSIPKHNNKEDIEFKRLSSAALEEMKDELQKKSQVIKSKASHARTRSQLDKCIQECEGLIQVWPDFYGAHLFLAECRLSYLMNGPFLRLMQRSTVNGDAKDAEDLQDITDYYPKILECFNDLQKSNPKNTVVYRGLWCLYHHLDSFSRITAYSENEVLVIAWREAVKNCLLMLDNNPSAIQLQEVISLFAQQGEDKEKNKDRLLVFSQVIKHGHFKNIDVAYQVSAFKCYGVLYEIENGMKGLREHWSSWLSDKSIDASVKAMTAQHLHALKLTFYNLMYHLAEVNFKALEELLLQRLEGRSQRETYLNFMQRFKNIFEGAKGLRDESCFREMFIWMQGVFKMLAELSHYEGSEKQALDLYEKAVEIYDFQSFEFVEGGALRDHICVLSACAHIRNSMSTGDPKVNQYYKRIMLLANLEIFPTLLSNGLVDYCYRDQVSNLVDKARRFLEADAQKEKSEAVVERLPVAIAPSALSQDVKDFLAINPKNLPPMELGLYYLNLDAGASKVDIFKIRQASTWWKRAIIQYSAILDGSLDINTLEKIVDLFAIDCPNQAKNQDRVELLAKIRECQIFEGLKKSVKEKVLAYLDASLKVNGSISCAPASTYFQQAASDGGAPTIRVENV